MPRRLALFLSFGLVAGCGPDADRRGATVLFASGADLQSINPLLTVHPLARQVQRYVLLTTLVRYDSTMTVVPYLARRWSWSEDGRRLTLSLFDGLRWHDGVPTTARDAAWTLDAGARPGHRLSPAGRPRALDRATATDDTTLVLDFARRQPLSRRPHRPRDPAGPPARHGPAGPAPAGGVERTARRQRPVPLRAPRANRRWVFARNPDFPAALGGPPLLERLVIAVVDEPMTKLAALTSGELDFAGIQPAHAEFVARDPRLVVRDYPLLFTNGIVFNARRPPFDELRAGGLRRPPSTGRRWWTDSPTASGRRPMGRCRRNWIE